MKIAVLGTRGIPNHYGGFEGFAEKFSVMMVERGHELTVFNSSQHPYKNNEYKGVRIITCFDAEDIIGTAGQFIYDLNCICECRKRDFDIILQLGYTSSSVWSFLFPSKSRIVTNMDGLEWKRAKYPSPVRSFLKQAEKWAVRHSDCLVADNTGIQQHLEITYEAESAYIPYGAELFSAPDEKCLREVGVLPYQFNLLIARLEPDNNIESIILGHLNATGSRPLLIVGNIQNSYAKELRTKYASERIIFKGGIYNSTKLNQLRWFSNFYFHGHSVGGTNPSLLEAMASSALICAHDNIFNRSVMGEDGFYFKSENDITELIQKNNSKEDFRHLIENNRKKIEERYSWGKVVTDYENIFVKCLKGQ